MMEQVFFLEYLLDGRWHTTQHWSVDRADLDAVVRLHEDHGVLREWRTVEFKRVEAA